MYAAAVVCVLFTAVSASQGPLNMPSVPWKTEQTDLPHPVICCSASAYTYKAVSVVSSVKDGSLSTEFIHQRGAYDAVAKMIAVEEVLGFTNGTEDTVKLISDFNNGVEYRITSQKGTIECEKTDIPTRFLHNCLTDEKFINWVTIGDRALTAGNWYKLWTNHPTEDVHVVYTFQHPECVDLGYISRGTDKATGAELWTDFHTRSDYSLGICDPDKWFKPPPECKAVKLLKATPQQWFGRLSPDGKRPIFW
ncbi:uncharacterized protein LOC119738309 [Patiria miniata]|uniref:Uncharacterized protein n=1 Tax=Patiria miniata TaxID=46514 RepID=A0A914AZF3_PATMI|nr:uncharacterized protein LOC119738309 [Patiria miniata]